MTESAANSSSRISPPISSRSCAKSRIWMRTGPPRLRTQYKLGPLAFPSGKAPSMVARQLLHELADALLPQRCLVCGRFGAALHEGCLEALPAAALPRCIRCWAPGPRSPCGACLAAPPAFEALRTPYLFVGPARRALLEAKFRGVSALLEPARGRGRGGRPARVGARRGRADSAAPRAEAPARLQPGRAARAPRRESARAAAAAGAAASRSRHRAVDGASRVLKKRCSGGS